MIKVFIQWNIFLIKVQECHQKSKKHEHFHGLSIHLEDMSLLDTRIDTYWTRLRGVCSLLLIFYIYMHWYIWTQLEHSGLNIIIFKFISQWDIIGSYCIHLWLKWYSDDCKLVSWWTINESCFLHWWEKLETHLGTSTVWRTDHPQSVIISQKKV